jgi:ubiquitin carboxyl-terminal hydrolase 22/27/51
MITVNPTSSNLAQGRKRKYDELFTGSIKDDPKHFTTNSMDGPCDPNGLRGIFNMGATCFMSVILQSFIHNPLIRNFYLSDGHQSGACCQENCLSCSMDQMFQDFYGQDHKSGFSASNILSSSWHTQQAAFAGLAGNDEQDAHEFFQFLAEELHKSAKGPESNQISDDSSRPQSRSGNNCECIVHQTFYGKLQSTLTCQHCGVVTTSVEPFLDLSLGLENIIKKRGGKGNKGGKGGPKRLRELTLQRCLDDEYKLPERCGYTCASCDHAQEGTKQLSIKRLPNVLCIQFKVNWISTADKSC